MATISRGTVRIWDAGRTYKPLGGGIGKYVRLQDELRTEKLQQEENDDASQFLQRYIRANEIYPTEDYASIYGLAENWISAGILSSMRLSDDPEFYVCRPFVNQSQNVDVDRFDYYVDGEQVTYIGDSSSPTLRQCILPLPGEFVGDNPISVASVVQDTSVGDSAEEEGEEYGGEEGDLAETYSLSALGSLSHVKTKFVLPPDPTIIMQLHLGAPPANVNDEQGMAWFATPPSFEICFGGESPGNYEMPEYSLYFTPSGGSGYESSLYWHNNATNEWKKLEPERGSALKFSQGKKAQMQSTWLYITRVGDFIVIADNYDYKDAAVYRIPISDDASWHPVILEGKLHIVARGIPYIFSLYATKMVYAQVQSPYYYTGYSLSNSGYDSDNPFFTNCYGLAVQLYDDATGEPTMTLKVPQISIKAKEDTQVAWVLTLNPHTWYCRTYGAKPTVAQDGPVQDSVEPILMDTSPQAATVNIWQYMKFEVESRGYSDHQTDIKAYQGAHSRDRGADYGIWMDNMLGQVADFKDGTCIQIYVGDAPGPYSTLLATLYTVQNNPSLVDGSLEIHAVDGYAKLSATKNFGFWPCFDGWKEADVIRFLAGCAYLGFPVYTKPELDPSEYVQYQLSLEDISGEWGTDLGRIPVGKPGKERLMPDEGKNALDVMRQAVKMGSGAEIWFDENDILHTGCPFCREKRTQDNYIYHNGTMWTGAVAGKPQSLCNNTVVRNFWSRHSVRPAPTNEGWIHAAASPRMSVSSYEMANRISIKSTSPDGTTMTVHYVDYASLHDPTSTRYKGYPVDYVEDYNVATNYQQLVQYAQIKIWELTHPSEYIQLTTPLDEDIKIGDVIKVYGAEPLNANEKYYRVESVHHEFNIRTLRNPRTTITAKRILEDSDA